MCMLGVYSDTKKVKLRFLHPHGPLNSFKYPKPQLQNINTVLMKDILTLTLGQEVVMHVYSLTKKK